VSLSFFSPIFLPKWISNIYSLRLDYELVKIYHPDSSVSRTPPASSGSDAPLSQEINTAEARFRAITAAYNTLRKGKSRANSARSVRDLGDSADVQMSDWRKRELRNRAELRVGGLDERWKERLMIGVLFLVSPSTAVRHPLTGPEDV
jgi:curved DNA-binding protein CbpA